MADRFEDASHLSVTDRDSTIVLRAIQLTQDRELQIEGALGLYGMRALTDGLQCTAAGLAILHLRVPTINDIDAKSIAIALRNNTNLRILSFTGTRLTHVGIMAVLNGFSHPATVAVYDNQNVIEGIHVQGILDILNRKTPALSFRASESLFTPAMVSQLKKAEWDIF